MAAVEVAMVIVGFSVELSSIMMIVIFNCFIFL